MAEAKAIEGEYDYIIVGAGSAGCVLANRLRADPANRVLLLEAGGRDNWIWFHIPVGYLFAIGNPRSDWMFKTEAEPGLNGRALNYPRGKVIGGSSSINAMIYMRGQAADYDHWRQLGLTGWGWDDVLPFFKQHEHHFLGASEHHAAGGEWRIEHPRVRWDLLDAFRAAAEQAGIKRIDDFNTGDNEGSCAYHVNQKRGRRWSAARGFLKPVLNRQNLRLETGCLVEAREFDGRRADGVRFRQNGEAKIARCRGEVILAAGSIGSIADSAAVRRRPRRASARARHSRRARQAGRRREPAGPSAAAHDLQGDRRQDAERDLRVAARPRQDVPRLRAAPARPADHGAVAARHLHPLRSDARARQHPVSRAAAVARQVRRAAAHVPGVHRERLQPAADQPRLRAAEVRRSGRQAGDPAELSLDRRGPARRRRFDPRHARIVRSRRCSRSSRRNICRAQVGGRRRGGLRRRRATSAPRSSIRSAPRRWACPAIRWRWSTSGCACSASKASA